jgi:hypothetical protein
LEALRADDGFLNRCEQLYAKGYKDWHILSAIYNRLLQLESARRELDLHTHEGREAHKNLSKEIMTAIFPASAFDGPEWEFAFKMHAITCLGTYGFEHRTSAISPDAIVGFLRDRMRHFELDVPHEPMFARPCGPWPEVYLRERRTSSVAIRPPRSPRRPGRVNFLTTTKLRRSGRCRSVTR